MTGLAPACDEFVCVAVPDVNAVLRGKALTSQEFARIGDRASISLPELVLGLDPDDAAVVEFPGSPLRQELGDLRVRFDPDALVPMAWNPGWSLALATPEWRDGSPCSLGSRVVAAAAVQAAADRGYEVVAAFEYEVRLRRASDGSPAFRAHQFSLAELQRAGGVLGALRRCCEAMTLPLAAVHVEGGHGLLELNVEPAPALESADRALLLKQAVKAVAADHGLEATFLAKPVEGEEGSGGHLHVSLWRDGLNALHDPTTRTPSEAMTRAVAGLLRHMSALSALYNPTLNSYKRLIPGRFAPVAACWGVDDRTAAVRVVEPGDPGSARVEIRRPGADANPYLVLAAAIHSLLDGLDRALTPPAGSESVATAAPLPASLEAALRAFTTEPRVEKWLGSAFASFFAATRQRELDAWLLAVSDWERRRYGHFV